MEGNKITTLPGDYIAGFVDGEGCFALKYRSDKQINSDGRIRQYYYWTAEFVIVLRSDDRELLNKVRGTLNCGQITIHKNFARFSVQNIRELNNIIIPFFNKFCLVGKKARDFKLWERGVQLIAKSRTRQLNASKGIRGFVKNEISIDDQNELRQIRSQMLAYKSHRLKDFKY